MKDYKVNGKVVDITLENGKIVKCATEWVEKTMKALDTDFEDVVLMFLEDNGYLENEEQEELDKQAKGAVKQVVKSEKPRAKTTREKKVNPIKQSIICYIAKALKESSMITDLQVENIDKIITFKVENQEFKIDLTQKRVKKSA